MKYYLDIYTYSLSSRLKGDYQWYPSLPKVIPVISYEYTGSRLISHDTGPKHNGPQPSLLTSYICCTTFVEHLWDKIGNQLITHQLIKLIKVSQILLKLITAPQHALYT